MGASKVRAEKGIPRGLTVAEYVRASLGVPFEPPVPRVRRSKLVERATGDLAAGGSVLVCACEGSGSSTFLCDVALRCIGLGMEARFLSLRGLSSAELPEAFTAAREELARQGLDRRGVLLVVDDVQRVEEPEAEDCARNVRLIALRQPLLMALSPRADLLAEGLPDHRVLTSSALAVRYDELCHWPTSNGERSSREFLSLTGGIISLAEAAREDLLGSGELRGCGYHERREALVLDAVGQGTMREERLLRSAMALLGEGTLDDLRALGVRCSPDVVEGTREEAPVLGIAQSGSRFSLVGGPVCPPLAVDKLVSEEPDLVFSAVQRLVELGAFDRAVRIAERAGSVLDLAPLVEAMPVEIYEAGGYRVIKGALANGRISGGALGAFAARIVANEASADDFDFCLERLDALETERGRAMAVQLRALSCIRASYGTALAWAEEPFEPDGPLGMDSVLADRCAAGLSAHWGVRRALADGDLPRALRLLSRVRGLAGRPTVSGALLTVDAHLARSAAGEQPTLETKAALASALAFLRESGEERLVAYEEGLVALGDALCGAKVDEVAASSALTEASRAGDALVRASLMLALALDGLSSDCPRSAEADAGEARRAADLGGSLSLSAAAEAVSAAAALMQDKMPEPPSEGLPCEFALFVRAAREAKGHKTQTSAADAPDPSMLTLLLLEASLRADAQVSERLWRAVPSSWRTAHGAWKRRAATRPAPQARRQDRGKGTTRVASRKRAIVARQADGTSVPQLSIGLMGGLSFAMDGVGLDPRRLRRGAARMLLAVLASRHGHQMAREEAQALFWPESSRRSGRSNLYSVLSSVRTGLGDRAYDVQHLMTTRETVALNRDCVTCDVDAFEALLTKVASSASSDEQRVSYCEEAQRSYQGGSFTGEGMEGARELQAYHDWLESRYVEALTMGSEAALRLGLPRQALAFAREAHGLSPLRNETVRCLMTALAKNGRMAEMEKVYRQRVRGAGPRSSRALSELGELYLALCGGDRGQVAPMRPRREERVAVGP